MNAATPSVTSFRPTDLEKATAQERVQWAVDTYGDGLVLTTSFGIQAAVMLHLVTRIAPKIPVIFIDTGYHFPETYRFAAELTKKLDLNLKTAFMGCKFVLPVMEEQKSGLSVNITTSAGFRHQVGGRVNDAYRTANAGLAAITRSTAMAYVKKGIRCNTVVVGTMHTPLVEQRLVKQLGASDAATLIAQRNAAVPMGHMGTGWDTANAVVFLVSDEASYITGIELAVDGGISAARV